MAKMTTEQLEKQIKDKKLMILGLVTQMTTADETEKDTIQETIDELTNDVNELEINLEELKEKEQGAATARNWAKTKDRIENVIKHFHMGLLPKEIVYCKDTAEFVKDRDPNLVNPQFYTCPLSYKSVEITIKTLHNALYGNFNVSGMTEKRLFDLFGEMGRTYLGSTSTYRVDKWDSFHYNRAQVIINNFWVQPARGEYNSDFDWMCDIPELKDIVVPGNYDKRYGFWLYCLCSGKKENADFVKEMIWFKHQNPHKADVTANTDFAGKWGGTGKGALTTFLRRVHTSMCVVTGQVKEVNGGFKAQWLDALYVNIDEGNRTELNMDELKKNTGTEERYQEAKHVDGQSVDNNITYLFTTNYEEGCVVLNGGGLASSDRRWSVINSEFPMVEYAQKIFGFDTKEEAYDFVDSIWRDCIKDRAAAAQFLGHLRDTITLTDKLLPLHGEDYWARFETTKDELTKCFDKILPVLEDQGVMATDWIHRIAQTRTENFQRKHKNVLADFEKYLTEKHISFETKNDTKITVDSADKGYVQVKAIRLTGEKYDDMEFKFDWSLISDQACSKYQKSGNKDTFGLDIRDADNVIQISPNSGLTAEEMLFRAQQSRLKRLTTE